MDKKEKEFLERLQAVFKTESKERLDFMSSGMLELEKAETFEDKELKIEEIFREAHSLKGAARAASMTDIETICQSLEGSFASLKRHTLELSPELFDTFSDAVDILTGLISPSNTEETVVASKQISTLVEMLSMFAKGQKSGGNWQLAVDKGQKAEEEITHETSKQEDSSVITDSVDNKDSTVIRDSPKLAKEQTALSDMVRVATSKLDSILLQAEEMIPLKIKLQQLSKTPIMS